MCIRDSHQAFEQGFAVGRRQVLPAVGGEDGGVEFVVQLTQDGDEAGFVDGFVPGGQGFAAAQFGEDVVHAGQRQLGVGGLLALAVGVELFGQGGDAGLLFGAGGGEGECLSLLHI